MGIDKAHKHGYYEEAIEGDTDDDKNVHLNRLNELAFEDLILSINTSKRSVKFHPTCW